MRFKIDWANLVVGSKFSVFALFYFVIEGNFLSTSPWGAYIWRGDLTEGFFASPVWGAYIWRDLLSEFYGISSYFQKNFFRPFGPHFGRKIRSGPYPGSGTVYY